MDYQELWNQLKAQMLYATERVYAEDSNLDEYMFRADAILRRMAQLEVEQCSEKKARQQELDLKFAEMIFSQKGE